MLDVTSISSSEYDSTEQSKKIDFINLKKYDPEIWSDYNVLEPLQEMKNFKVEE